MSVSIIIPVHNREAFIKQCLLSILKLKTPSFEIIIIDDGSTDNSADIIRSIQDSRIHLFQNKTNKGLAYSRNKGISLAKSNIIAFTDSDCEVDENWLCELIKAFHTDKNIMIVGGRIIDPIPKTYWELVNNGSNHISQSSGYVPVIIGCNMAFRREFLLRNQFELSNADELDLCIRCASQGKKVFYTSLALVIHHHRSTLKSTVLQHFYYGCGHVYAKLKNNGFPYVNFGAILLILISLSVIFANWGIASFLFLMYLLLVGYWNTRKGTRTWKDWWDTFPAYFLAFTAFTLGNIFFFFYIPKRYYQST